MAVTKKTAKKAASKKVLDYEIADISLAAFGR